MGPNLAHRSRANSGSFRSADTVPSRGSTWRQRSGRDVAQHAWRGRAVGRCKLAWCDCSSAGGVMVDCCIQWSGPLRARRFGGDSGGFTSQEALPFTWRGGPSRRWRVNRGPSRRGANWVATTALRYTCDPRRRKAKNAYWTWIRTRCRPDAMLAELIIKRRQRLNLSQPELARRSGISRARIGDLERGNGLLGI
jgi:hypothetical protein